MSGESPKRTLQFTEGASDKYWEVWTDGCDVTTHWGRTGTEGQSKTKSYDSDDAAEKAAEKAVAQKLNKGYTETTVVTNAMQSEVANTANEPIEETNNLGDLLNAAMVQLEEKVGETFAQQIVSGEGPPKTISLIPADADTFPNASLAARCTEEICDKGFELCGDYTIEPLGVAVRAFLARQRVRYGLQTGIIEWIDLTVSNSDETRECWSSQVMHDGITPPWVTFQLLPRPIFNSADRMVSEHSGEAPAVYTQVDFVDAFVNAHERRWPGDYPTRRRWNKSKRKPVISITIESLRKGSLRSGPRFIFLQHDIEPGHSETTGKTGEERTPFRSSL